MLKILKSRKFRQGSFATAITVLVAALVVAFNMVATALSDKYSLNIDLTENKIFGISDDTKEFLNGLNKDVQIYVMNTEEGFTSGGEYAIQANEVIKKYAQQSQYVKINYIDLVRNPNFAASYPELQLTSNTILVTCGDRVTDLTPNDLYNIETDYWGNGTIASSKAEQAMTSAMLKVTSDKIVTVSVLNGHNESELPAFRSLLEMNNYEIIEQNLLTENISPDSTIAIINSPTRDFDDSDLKKLDNYLRNDGKYGKTLFYLASAEQPELPNLLAFLADWGIDVGSGVVFEMSDNRCFDLNRFIAAVDYTEEVYSKSAIERKLYTAMPFARPLSALFETKSSVTVTAPLMFSQTAGIMPLDADESWQPSESNFPGLIPALLVAQSLRYEGTTPMRSNVVVCGSSLAVGDNYLGSTRIGNSEYFLSLLNTLAEREDIVSIQSKTIGGNELGVNSAQQILLGVVLAVILPLTVLIFGIAIWLRRRHR